MKCPVWLLDAMGKDEPVKCWAWDNDETEKRLVKAFGFSSPSHYPFITTGGNWRHAEPYMEPEYKFHPDQRVLARDENHQDWCLARFSHYRNDMGYSVGGAWAQQCIPYKGNEHLLGTTDSPKN